MFLALPPPAKAVVSSTGVMGRNENRKHLIDLISSLRPSQKFDGDMGMPVMMRKVSCLHVGHPVTVCEMSTVYPGPALNIKNMR